MSLKSPPELLQGGAPLDGLGNGLAEVAEQVVAHAPGDHETPGMLAALEVIPAAGGDVDLAAEERLRLLEGQAAVCGGHLRTSSRISARPVSPAWNIRLPRAVPVGSTGIRS